MKLLSARATDSYRPKDMNWFHDTLGRSGLVRTPAFALPSADIGFTIAQATPDRKAVIGADLALKDISASLSRQRASPSAQLALTESSGQVLAASHGAWAMNDAAPVQLPTLATLGLPILAKAFSGMTSVNGTRTLASAPWKPAKRPSAAPINIPGKPHGLRL
ncbi:hypothetical protein [Propionivibrio sp.]|uniref:hypothetical protein n=1 Tax=Propionivibrio sp. TaxID=2212460 RepID=UPI003BF1E88F